MKIVTELTVDWNFELFNFRVHSKLIRWEKSGLVAHFKGNLSDFRNQFSVIETQNFVFIFFINFTAEFLQDVLYDNGEYIVLH